MSKIIEEFWNWEKILLEGICEFYTVKKFKTILMCVFEKFLKSGKKRYFFYFWRLVVFVTINKFSNNSFGAFGDLEKTQLVWAVQVCPEHLLKPNLTENSICSYPSHS